MVTTSKRTFRPVEILRAGWGAAMLVAPGRVLTAVHRGPADPVDIAVARVLGARHLAQAAATVARPGAAVLAVGVYADLAHAASMVGLAAADRRRRRAGITDAAIGLGLAAAGARDLRSSPAASAGRRDAVATGVLGRAPGGRWLLRRLRSR